MAYNPVELRGLGTVLVTPFHKDGQIVNVNGFYRLLERQLAEGVNMLVPFGTTGTARRVNECRQRQLVKHTVEKAAEAGYGANVILGISHDDPAVVIERAKFAGDLGVDAVVVTPETYVGASQDGHLARFNDILVAVPEMSFVIYNVPSRTGKTSNIVPATFKELAKFPNVVATKEAYGDMGQMRHYVEIATVITNDRGYPLTVLSGDDLTATDAITAYGASWLISVCSTLIPDSLRQLVEGALQDDEDVLKNAEKLRDVFQATMVGGNPQGVTYLLREMNVTDVGDCFPHRYLGQPERLEKVVALARRGGLIE